MNAVAAPTAVDREKAEMAPLRGIEGALYWLVSLKLFGVQGLAPARGDVTGTVMSY